MAKKKARSAAEVQILDLVTQYCEAREGMKYFVLDALKLVGDRSQLEVGWDELDKLFVDALSQLNDDHLGRPRRDAFVV